MADLITVKTFFENADANAEFHARVAAALAEWAIAARAEAAPDPLTITWTARQEYARSALTLGPARLMDLARTMLPALAVKANDAGLLTADGNLTATDTQIRATINDAFIDLFAANIPAAE